MSTGPRAAANRACRHPARWRCHQAREHPRDALAKRIYPHLFRHQLITYLTKQDVISPKLQLLSGHTPEQSLAVDRGLAWSDVSTSV